MWLPRPADSRPSPAHPVADSDRWAKARKPNSAARRAGEQLERCTGGELPIKAHAHAPHTVVQLFRNPSSAAVYSSGCLRRWPTCSDTCHRTSRTSAHVPFCRRAATSSASLCRKQAAFGQLSLPRLLSAPDHASCCPTLRPAVACWPAIPGLGFNIVAHFCGSQSGSSSEKR